MRLRGFLPAIVSAVVLLVSPAVGQDWVELQPIVEASFPLSGEPLADRGRLRVARLVRTRLVFDLSQVDPERLARATLVLTIAENRGGWGPSGRLVHAYRLLASDGEVDPCAGGRIAAATDPGFLHTDDLRGEVAWDVTSDVRAGADCGWLVTESARLSQAGIGRPGKGEQAGGREVSYFSTAGAEDEGNPRLAPRLVVEYSDVRATSRITGHVFHAETGDPLPGVWIKAAFYTGADEEAPDIPGDPAITDSEGAFTYETPPLTGSTTFLVRIRHHGYTEALRLVRGLLPGRCIRVDDAFLTPQAPKVPVKASEGGVVPDPTGEVQLVIPPDALASDSEVAVTVLPDHRAIRDRLPALVATEGTFIDIVGVSGERTKKCVTLMLPNRHGLPAGTVIPFGKLNHNTLEWQDLRETLDAEGGDSGCRDDGEPEDDAPLGMGIVRGEGADSYIELKFNHFCTICTGYCLPPGGPTIQDGGSGDPSGDPGRGGSPGRGNEPCNSVVNEREGHLWEVISLPSFVERGTPFGLHFGYASRSACPSATLSPQVDFPNARPVEATVYDFQIEGAWVNVHYGRTETTRQHGCLVWSGRNDLGELLPTGSYPYSVFATSLNANVDRLINIAISGVFGGPALLTTTLPFQEALVPFRTAIVKRRVVLLNLTRAPYGAGWSCLEEERLRFDPDGCVVLVAGNSDWRLFTPRKGDPSAFDAPPGEFSTLSRLEDGSYIRRLKNGTAHTYDERGRLLAKVDRYGYTTRFSYQGGLLTGVTTPTGHHFALQYRHGKLLRVFDSAGRQTSFTVDSRGDLVAVTDGTGSTRRFEYDAEHLLIAQEGPRGERSEYEFENGRVVATRAYDTRAAGARLLRLRRFQPSALKGEALRALQEGRGFPELPIAPILNREDRTVDARGCIRKQETDPRGATVSEEDALGRRTRYAYDSRRLLTMVTLPNGAMRCFVYDDWGNLTIEKDLCRDDSRLVREFSGPPFHLLTKIRDAEGKETTFEHDPANGALRGIIDALGNRTELEYEDARFPDRPTRTIFASGEFLEFEYDLHGNVTAQRDAAGRTHRFEYDLAGNVTARIDPLGNTTGYEYDALNRLVTAIDALENSTAFSYDEAGCGCATGNLTSVTLPNGVVIRYEYDGLHRLIAATDPLDGRTTYAHDGEGNVVALTNREGEVIEYDHDCAGQLTTKTTFPGCDVTVYEYDLLGNLRCAANAASDLTFEHDPLGRLVETTSAYPVEVGPGLIYNLVSTLRYAYDRVGNRRSLTEDGALVTSYAYDDLHRLEALVNPQELRWEFDYDLARRRTELRHPNGVVTRSSYDELGQLASIAHEVGGQPLARIEYLAYDDAGNLIEERLALPGKDKPLDTSYGYDPLHRLVEVRTPGGPPSKGPDPKYSYDIANRILSDGTKTYRHDREGRLREVAEEDIVTRFAYSPESELLRIEQFLVNGTKVLEVRYAYDPLGRRVLKDVNGVRTHSFYDGEDIILQQPESAAALATSFTHGPGIDEPLAVSSEAGTRFLHADRLGSILLATDGNGAPSATQGYAEFGELLTFGTGATHAYTGREYDPEAGLYFYRNRYYAAELGRFVSEDPLGLGGGSNLYTYVENNPISYVDPFGLRQLATVTVTAGGGVGYFSGEGGWMYALDPKTGRVYRYEYVGVSPGLSLSFGLRTPGGSSFQLGVLDVESPTDITGIGIAVSGFTAIPGKGLGFQVYGNPVNGSAGSSGGYVHGIGVSVSGMVTYTWLVEEFDIADVPTWIRELLERCR